MNSFGKNLKDCREQSGFTQKRLGNALALTPQAISKWETGVSLPDLITLAKISHILNVSADSLLNGC